LRIFAVANADHAIGQGRYFDAVAVGEAQGTFDPSSVLHGVVSCEPREIRWIDTPQLAEHGRNLAVNCGIRILGNRRT
jgi:hypothetical protein